MKFYKQKSSGKVSEVQEGFNFWAFLFSWLWFLYHGMIGRAIAIFFGLLIFYALLNWIGLLIGWIIIGFLANKQYEDYLLSKGYNLVKKKK
jgi:hypothetical protein